MGRFAAIFSAAAIVGLAAPGLGAPTYTFGPDNFYNAFSYYPQIPHDNPGTYYSTLPNGPVATEDGLVWLNTGSGPALKGGNLAVSIYYENTSSAWQLEETEFTTDGYSGYFMATANPTWGAARVISNPLIVGSETIPVGGAQGDETFQQGLFYLQFWTDPTLESTGKSAYSSYAQALAASETGAAGVYVAEAAQFKVDFGFDSVAYANKMGMYMPAVVLQRAGFPGDANGDGTVDVNDLTIVLSHFGQGGMTWSQGDFNGDGTVDVNDLTIVLAHFGQSVGSSAGGNVSAVPEPGALALLAAWFASLLAYALRVARH